MPEPLTRLSVNLNEETAEALKTIVQWKGVTYTEAIRRAISVYMYVLEAEDDGASFLIETSKGDRKRVVLR